MLSIERTQTKSHQLCTSSQMLNNYAGVLYQHNKRFRERELAKSQNGHDRERERERERERLENKTNAMQRKPAQYASMVVCHPPA